MEVESKNSPLVGASVKALTALVSLSGEDVSMMELSADTASVVRPLRTLEAPVLWMPSDRDEEDEDEERARCTA